MRRYGSRCAPAHRGARGCRPTSSPPHLPSTGARTASSCARWCAAALGGCSTGSATTSRAIPACCGPARPPNTWRSSRPSTARSRTPTPARRSCSVAVATTCSAANRTAHHGGSSITSPRPGAAPSTCSACTCTVTPPTCRTTWTPPGSSCGHTGISSPSSWVSMPVRSPSSSPTPPRSCSRCSRPRSPRRRRRRAPPSSRHKRDNRPRNAGPWPPCTPGWTICRPRCRCSWPGARPNWRPSGTASHAAKWSSAPCWHRPAASTEPRTGTSHPNTPGRSTTTR